MNSSTLIIIFGPHLESVAGAEELNVDFKDDVWDECLKSCSVNVRHDLKQYADSITPKRNDTVFLFFFLNEESPICL